MQDDQQGQRCAKTLPEALRDLAVDPHDQRKRVGGRHDDGVEEGEGDIPPQPLDQPVGQTCAPWLGETGKGPIHVSDATDGPCAVHQPRGVSPLRRSPYPRSSGRIASTRASSISSLLDQLSATLRAFLTASPIARSPLPPRASMFIAAIASSSAISERGFSSASVVWPSFSPITASSCRRPRSSIGNRSEHR